MRFFFILFFIPTLTFAQTINLICQEKSFIDYDKVQIIEFKSEDIIEFEYTYNKSLSNLNERYQDLNYKYMGEDDVSYHFRIETDFSFNTLILYKNIFRYERNIFYPDSINLKKTYYGECNKSNKILAVLF